MTHGHIKTLEFKKDAYTYELEIDAEDKDNLVVLTATIIGGPIARDTDMDTTIFEDMLDDEDWETIKEGLK